jgi:hypothetical protein
MLITPFKSNFVGPIEETNMKELNAINEGIGLVEWTIKDWNHQVG